VGRYTNFRSFTGIESRYDILPFTQKFLWTLTMHERFFESQPQDSKDK
jgi:hypothetical protein